MANLIHTDVYDNGLVTLTNATSTVLHLCSTQPATFANVATYTIANKATPTVSSPTARTPGRKVTISAVTTGGSVTTTATAISWALVDGTRLLATGTCTSQALTSGNSWTCGAIDIGIPDPA
jgi:hypothetical protein